MKSEALIPVLVNRSNSKNLYNLVSLFCGLGLLYLLSQLSIKLSFTPVPITGQTFGVALLALLWGSKRAFSCVALYISIGAVGLPVFALSSALITFGPSSGYLIGMLIASFIVGRLSDLGYTKTFGRALAASYVGSTIIFTCGVFVLSFYVPSFSAAISLGVLPFLAGDLIKNSLAASIATYSKKIGQ